MALSRIRASALASSKRQASRAKDLWLDFFDSALSSLLQTDNETVKEVSEDEAKELCMSARRIADAALNAVEERFPNV